MKNTKLLFVLAVALFGCNSKIFTLEDLKKEKWDSLAPGIHYISTENKKNIAFKKDSIEIKIKGITGSTVDPVELSFDTISSELNKTLISVLKLYIPDSKAGYLKINLTEMMVTSKITGRIYLRGNYSLPFSFTSDSTDLKSISGIKEIRFISKEVAKQEYLNAGNQDWSKVLDINPLPDAIEIELKAKDWSEEELNSLKKVILNKLTMASEITFPSFMYKKNDNCYFFEYKRL